MRKLELKKKQKVVKHKFLAIVDEIAHDICTHKASIQK